MRSLRFSVSEISAYFSNPPDTQNWISAMSKSLGAEDNQIKFATSAILSWRLKKTPDPALRARLQQQFPSEGNFYKGTVRNAQNECSKQLTLSDFKKT